MTDLENLKNQRDGMLECIKVKNDLEVLCQNPLFKQYIIDGFCMKDCARAIHVSVDMNVPEEQRKDAVSLAQSGGYLMQYIQRSIAFGNNAETRIRDVEAAISEVQAEE